jgi:hypothetical protein
VVKKQSTRKVVAKKITTATKAVKKPIPTKETKPKTVRTQKKVTTLVKQSNETNLAVWKKIETANELVMKDWGSSEPMNDSYIKRICLGHY